jgi:glycosyltransferase involved in cell wall biosynthesis
MKPTIFINGRFLSQTLTGVQRYATELISAFSASEPSDLRFIVLTPRDATPPFELEHIPIRRVGNLTGHLWEQLELPFYARDGWLLSLCNTGPLTKRRQIVTIHDAAVFAMPESFSPWFRRWYRLLLPALAKVAARVITVSHFSKGELVRWCGTPPQKITVIYEGKEQALRPVPDRAVLTRHALVDHPFTFAVSSRDPRKNLKALAQAAERLAGAPFAVVTAGGTNPKVFQDCSDDAAGHIKHLGYVSDGELRALYEAAWCFVYPSRYEGFGLPPLEAMACGCPVITSLAPPMPEVCGEAALYFDPDDPDDLADKIARLMSDAELREAMRARGLRHVIQYSWARCAAEHLEVIRQVTRA